MRIVAVIPARMASTRFPGKPMALIHGIPMIGHCFYRVSMCPEIDATYVATCDQEIYEYVTSIGGDAVMTADTHERASDRTAEAMVKSTDIEGFLASMKAKAIFERPEPGSRDRILQLLTKTNQFKLNKKTFTYSELVNREKDFIVLRLVDRLQDYGIVSVAILSSDLDTENAIIIENWVMSCRVFARRLEFVMLEQILDRAEKLHAEAIKLTYKKNERNGLIGDLLPELGFDPKVKDDLWYLRIVREKNVVVVNLNYPPHHMDVISL